MRKTVVELCCGTADEVRLAAELGADRIELCSALACGGVTPSFALVEFALNLGVETMAMVRSREGNFVFSSDEFTVQLKDAHQLVKMGVSGLVFGCLTVDGSLHLDQMKALVEVADGRPTMIHRASDSLKNQNEGLEQLQKLGVQRVLTSGQSTAALDGVKRLNQMVSTANLEIVAGGGIRPDHVVELLTQSGVSAIHFAARKNIDQPGYAGIPEPIPDPEMIVQMLEAVRAYDSSLA